MERCNSMDRVGEVHEAAKRDLAVEALRQFGEVRLKVTGTSMLPSVWPGDILTVRKQCAEQLLPGEQVLCYRNQAFVAHRLVEQRGDLFVTQGDSLPHDDLPFRRDEVLGAVVSIIRDGRPVALTPVWRNGVVSRILQRSELCVRLLLRLGRLKRRNTLLWGG